MSREELQRHLGKYNDVVSIFHAETDRAAAVLAGSYLEVLLEKLLRTRMQGGSTFMKTLFNGTGPLATFSARISLAYAIGLLPEYAYRDLTLIRRIRNHFAHHMSEASFEEPEVRDRCAEFSLVKQFKDDPDVQFPTDARSRFLLSAGMTTVAITEPVVKERQQQQEASADEDEDRQATSKE